LSWVTRRIHVRLISCAAFGRDRAVIPDRTMQDQGKSNVCIDSRIAAWRIGDRANCNDGGDGCPGSECAIGAGNTTGTAGRTAADDPAGALHSGDAPASSDFPRRDTDPADHRDRAQADAQANRGTKTGRTAGDETYACPDTGAGTSPGQ